jgi:hypothetical protein
MYVSDEIFADVAGPFADDRDGIRLAQFRQTLDAFLEGAEFSVAEDPYVKPSDAMIARVDVSRLPLPYAGSRPTDRWDLWDIRVIVPKPGIRALGGFVKLDTFVALTWNYRESLDEPGQWDAEIKRCQETWEELFGAKEPFKGRSLHEYLTNFYPV